MFNALIIVFREGFEAFLTVAIIMAYLRKTGRDWLRPAVYAGIAVSVLASFGLGWLLQSVNQPLWEGVLGIVAAILVATFVIHMWRTAPRMKKEMETSLDRYSSAGSRFLAVAGVFAFTLLMVTREGMETALMLIQVRNGRFILGSLLGILPVIVSTFNGASSVVVGRNGDIFVGDGHGGNTNDRVVKFDKTGKQLLTFGKHGKGPGEFDALHGIAMDSQGRIFVADRSNSRIQIFDQDGKFIDQWKQFGRPSGIHIDRNDAMIVADSQSNSKQNPGYRRGIYVGSARDGKVTALIPFMEPDAEKNNNAGVEGVAIDAKGNVYGAEVSTETLKKYAKVASPN